MVRISVDMMLYTHVPTTEVASVGPVNKEKMNLSEKNHNIIVFIIPQCPAESSLELMNGHFLFWTRFKLK